MKEEQIKIEPFVFKKITMSKELSSVEKVNFLRYVWYLTLSEKKQLVNFI